MYKNLVVFDLDGVILESLEVKTQAFEEMYSEYGKEIVSKVRAYHLNNGGISRYKKIKYFHKNFLNLDLSNNDFDKLLKRFASIVFSKVVNSKFVNGFDEYIRSILNNSYICLSTGTPTKEAKEILEYKKIIHYFSEIYGSPSEKKNHLYEILQKNEFKDRFFLGDAMSDYQAAKEFNFKFLLREHKYNQEMKKLDQVYDTFSNYYNLNKNLIS